MDETLPNFIKRQPQGGNGTTKNQIKPSKSCLKHINLREGKVNLIKLQD